MKVVTGSTVVDARISEWMCDMHKERADDPHFSAMVFQSMSLQGGHARWKSELRDAECEVSLARAADAQRWRAFRDEAGEEEAEGPDRDWPGFLALGPAVNEVNEVLKIIDAGVVPSPQDDVVGQALKLGGEALAETLSVLFAVAMRGGACRRHGPLALSNDL